MWVSANLITIIKSIHVLLPLAGILFYAIPGF